MTKYRAYTILIEYAKESEHILFSSIKSTFYTSGQLILMPISYILRDFININWTIFAISALTTILAVIFLKESPEWLLVQKKYDKAKEIL